VVWFVPTFHPTLQCRDKDRPTPDPFFAQTNLPVAPPFLEFFFAGVIVDFEPDRLVDAAA
jgi:hypothetical protein